MPVFYQKVIDEATQLAIWKIEEPESFFLQHIPLVKNVSHPHKRLQHLAGRFLLTRLAPSFPVKDILISERNKPYLANDEYHFSISHCGDYVAVILSTNKKKKVGIDIEMVTPRIENFTHKFMNNAEMLQLQQWEYLSQLHLELTTVMWSAKEAVYKWYGLGGLDFKKHMKLNGSMVMWPNEEIAMPFLFDKEKAIPLMLHAKILKHHVLAWVVH